jgi:hypothetical protein
MRACNGEGHAEGQTSLALKMLAAAIISIRFFDSPVDPRIVWWRQRELLTE